MQDEMKRIIGKTAKDFRAVAEDLENIARGMETLPPTLLGDGLDDEPMFDDHGYPTDMDSAERQAIEEKEYRDGLETAVESNKPEESVTLEDIRKVLVEKKRAGFIGEVKALITEYGVDRISALGEDVFGEFIVKARAIGETV